MAPLPERQTMQWSDTGLAYTAGEETYTAGEQPLAETDNRFNYNVSTDIINLFNALGTHAGRHAPGGEDSLETHYLAAGGATAQGDFDLNGHSLVDGARTVYSGTGGYIRTDALQHPSVTVTAGDYLSGGGSVRLGQAVRIDARDHTTPVPIATLEPPDRTIASTPGFIPEGQTLALRRVIAFREDGGTGPNIYSRIADAEDGTVLFEEAGVRYREDNPITTISSKAGGRPVLFQVRNGSNGTRHAGSKFKYTIE